MERLLAVLEPQLTAETELLIELDNKEKTIGHKRNNLLGAASGEYIAFVDDDDLVSATYVSQILASCRHHPDCIGFRVKRLVDGKMHGEAIHSLTVDKWETVSQGKLRFFRRTPNHLNPVKRSLASIVGFQDISIGEDADYAHRLRPLLKTEHFIDDYLYEYHYLSKRIRFENGGQGICRES